MYFLLASAFFGVALSACVDGVNNVITLADASIGEEIAHFKNVKLQTYDKNNVAFCENSLGAVHLPGSMKIVSGTVTVSRAFQTRGAQVYMTLTKNSFLIGTVCKNGNSQNPLISSSSCKFDLCQEIGADICTLISTPGEHDLNQLESKGLNNTIFLSPMEGIIRSIVKGYWRGEMSLTVSNVSIADVVLPSNESWLYIDAESS